jgi:protein TonB
MWECTGGGEMGTINNYGIFISVLIHALVMTIPISMVVVQKFDEIELFVMNEERPVTQEQKVVKMKKTTEITKTLAQKKKEFEKPARIDKRPKIKEEKIIEPEIISNKSEAIALSMTEKPNPPKAEVHENISTPRSSLSQQQIFHQDVEFGSAEGPKFLRRELPVYPFLARRLGKEGRVVLRLTIDKNGKLLNIQAVENSDYGFTEAAIEAVKKSLFLPAKKDGKPIASRAILPVRFKLRRD